MHPMNETVAFAKLFIESGVSSDGARAALVRLRRSAELTASVATVVAEFARIDDAVNADVATFKRFFRQPQAANIVAVATLLDHPEAAFLRVANQTSVGQDLNPVPFVTGADLIALGLKPGPVFKKILFDAETQQLNGVVTTKEAALEFVKGNL